MTDTADSGVVRAGALSALLADIARGPERSGGTPVLAPGSVVGRFELVKEIGRGGFGVVWEARDRELGRAVAFKAVPAGRADVREERLLREAEAAARLTHPNIVTLYDVGRMEGGAYIVLELLRGETLGRRLEQGPIPLREACASASRSRRGSRTPTRRRRRPTRSSELAAMGRGGYEGPPDRLRGERLDRRGRGRP